MTEWLASQEPSYVPYDPFRVISVHEHTKLRRTHSSGCARTVTPTKVPPAPYSYRSCRLFDRRGADQGRGQ